MKDVGKYLERFGYPETVAKGTARSAARQWGGPVYRIDYGTLVGSLDLKAEKGQFVKVKPGVGDLLGVLSLQSLPRRISLDFRDVFSEGFAFDSINGSAKIAQGVATTDNLAMTGPAASVAIVASRLANETQRCAVPVLGDSVAVAAGVALLNPIVGAGALIAQRLFKDPLGQMFSYEYQVTGSWEDPKVVTRAPELATPGRKRRRPRRRAPEGQPQEAAMWEAFKVAAVQMVSEPSLAANLDAAGALVAEAAAARGSRSCPSGSA